VRQDEKSINGNFYRAVINILQKIYKVCFIEHVFNMLVHIINEIGGYLWDK